MIKSFVPLHMIVVISNSKWLPYKHDHLCIRLYSSCGPFK